MSQPLTVTAIFHHAEKTLGGWMFEPMGKPALTVTLEAGAYPEIEQEVRGIVATELRHHCAVWLRLPRDQKRKPSGWDRFTRGLQFLAYDGEAPAVVATGRPKPYGITLTKAAALAIQAKQLDHYAPDPAHPLRAAVAAKTTADELDDEPYSVVDINRHIPRGGDLEFIMADLRARGIVD